MTFHTFRHWKATTEYAKTKDILRVMRMLGHKSIQNTLLYTQLITLQERRSTRGFCHLRVNVEHVLI